MDVSAWARTVLGSRIFFAVLSMTTRTEAMCLPMGTDRLGLLKPKQWSAAGGFIYADLESEQSKFYYKMYHSVFTKRQCCAFMCMF